MIYNGIKSNNSFTRLLVTNDKLTLSLSDRREHVHDSARHVIVAVAEKVEFLLWEKWGEEVERNTVADELRCTSIDLFYAYKREVLVTDLRRLDFSCHCVTGLERVLLDLEL